MNSAFGRNMIRFLLVLAISGAHSLMPDKVLAQIPAPGSPTGLTVRPKERILDDRWPLMFTWNRNKVNWWHLSWRSAELPSTTLYYYEKAEPIARMASTLVVESDSTLQSLFRYDLQTYTKDKTIPKILYTSHHTFEQTNTIAQPIPEGVGGFTEFIKGRVVFPYTGSNADFRHVLVHENTHIHMIHKLRHVFKANGVFDLSKLLPLVWFSEGLAEYESIGRDPATGTYRLDPDTEMYLRDGVINNNLPTIKQMRLFPDWRRVYKFGHALLQYLGSRYSPDRVHELLSQWHHQFPNRNSYTFFRRRSEDSYDPLNPGVTYLDPYFVRIGDEDVEVTQTPSGWMARTADGLSDSLNGESVENLVRGAENIELDGQWYRIIWSEKSQPAVYRPDSGLHLSWGGQPVSRILKRAREEYEKEAYKLMSFDRLLEWWFDTDFDDLTLEWHRDVSAYYEPWLEGRTFITDLRTMGRSAPELWPTVSDDGKLVFYKAFHDDFIFTVLILDLETGHSVQLARENTPETESIHILTEGGDIRKIGENRYQAIFTAQRRNRDVIYSQEVERLADGRLQLSGTRELCFDPGESDLVSISGVRYADNTDRILFSGLSLDGYQDIYLADVRKGGIEKRLTHDLASDRMPVLWKDKVVFSSDRASPPTTFAYHLFTVDPVSGEITQLTDGTGEELNPNPSPDGERLFFQSDASGVTNIYIWTEYGDPFQVTDVATGVFVPAPISADTLIVSGFNDEEYMLYEVAVPRDPVRVESRPDSSIGIGALYCEEPILLSVNRPWEEGRTSSADALATEPLESRSYRPAFSLDDFYASSEFGGYRAYNAAVFGTEIRFSDILGDHRLGAALWNGARRGLDDLSWIFSYWNQKRRVKLGGSIFRTSGIYYNYARQAFFIRERAGFSTQFNIPFSQFTDVDLYLGSVTERRRQGTISGSMKFKQLELGAGFTRDVSTWTAQGPHSGWVLSAFYDHIFNMTDDFSTFTRYLVTDVRGYLPLHRQIVAAGRYAWGHSSGTEPEFFFLGGGFFLRGYWNLYDLYGSSYELINTELRIQPLELMDINPPRIFEQSGWPLQFVLFAEGGRSMWKGGRVGPLGSAGMSLRLTVALPFVLEYAWYKREFWKSGGDKDRGLVVTLMF